MFKRKIYKALLDWKERYNGSRAALIQGARRVGKSTVAEEFAKNEYRSYIRVDFSQVSDSMLDVFKDINDLDMFFLRLQAETNIALYERQSAILFDEIQLAPKVRQAIKHLVADQRYDYIETGSLLSIRKNVRGIVIPSEEVRLDMHPMDYEEFLWAIGSDNNSTISKLAATGKPFGDATNRKLMRDFRVYMAVGGMPQAVEAYIQKQNFSDIDSVKREIIELYRDDLHKIDPSGRISRIFDAIPSQLALQKKRFVISRATGKKKTNKDEEYISSLLDSRIVTICNNVMDPGVSLSQTKNDDEFKLYLADTGLFVTMLFNDDDRSHEDIYRKLLSDKLPENLGYLYENAAAQIITASGKKLYYHTWRKEESTHSYEVDFLIVAGTKVVPIEVKSSQTIYHESIDAFAAKYPDRTNLRLIVSAKDRFSDGQLQNWPIYCLPYLLGGAI